MPVSDSILTTVDSVSNNQLLNVTDSSKLILADTAKINETVREITQGFEGLLLPSTPQNETWVFGVLMALLLIFVYSYNRSSGWLTESVKSFFKVKERTSIFNKTTVRDFESQAFLFLFSIVVFSLEIFLLFYDEELNFSLTVFLRYLGVTTGFFIFKYILIQFTGYIFTNKQKLKQARESYYNIIIYLGILIYPLMIFRIYSAEFYHNIADIIIYVLFTFAFITLIIKLFQIFFEIIDDSFYLLLYLCTLEFLPFFILMKVYKTII